MSTKPDQLQYSPQTNTYAWSADGRIAQTAVSTVYNGNTTTVTHDYGWDGDDALYWVDTSGGGPLIYIEKLGVLNGAGYSTPLLGVYDRDISGTTAAVHDYNGYGAWQIDPVDGAYKKMAKGCQTSCGAQYGTVGFADPTGPGLSPSRSDGYSDSVNTFQGVRAFDPYSAQWTAPDAYAGEVNDPMSQKPYMWNDNNPIAYSDPTGYDPSLVSKISSGFTRLLSGLIHETITKPLMRGSHMLVHGNATQKIGGAALIVSLGFGGGESEESIGLTKQLVSQGQLADALLGRGTSIAGAGSAAGRSIDDLPRLLSQYGGNAGDWAKMTTKTYTAADGKQLAVRWYENVSTGLRVEFKSKLSTAKKR